MTAHRAPLGVDLSALSPADRDEIERFAQWIDVQEARKRGADPDGCALLEAAIYPDQEPQDGAPKVEA